MSNKTAIMREDDNELLGFIVQDGVSWRAQTVFGYDITRVEDRVSAEHVVKEKGLGYLMGVWQYFDKDDQEWHPCVLKEVNEHRVTVIRTNAMGYQDPDDYKLVTIARPTDAHLVKG